MVLLLVHFDVSDPGEGSAADLTAVGFLSGVNSLVFLQVASLREHFAARRAVKRLLSRVDTLMDLHLLGTVKRFAAETTNKESLFGRRLIPGFTAVGERRG